MDMGLTLSVYLDLLRFLAAVTVFVHHLANRTGHYDLINTHGGDAVMLFFVLSGFVIAHVTATKEKTPEIYAVSRLARLYSVALPALLFTIALDGVGRSIDPALYADYTHPWIRAAISATFTNQLWSIDIRPWSNTPYWSISYEFWYYVCFGIATFAKRKALLLGAWAVLVGPCILLLLPIWLMGVWVYRHRPTVSYRTALGLFFGAPVLYGVYCASGLKEPLTAFTNAYVIQITGDPGYLHMAKAFLHDYIVGILVGLHFIGAYVVCQKFSFGKISGAIRKAASYTFTIYLLHNPVLVFLMTALPDIGYTRDLVICAALAITVYAIGDFTEQKKESIRALLLRLRPSTIRSLSTPTSWRDAA